MGLSSNGDWSSTVDHIRIKVSLCIIYFFAGVVVALNIHLISEPISQAQVLLCLRNYRSRHLLNSRSYALRFEICLRFLGNFTIHRESDNATHRIMLLNWGYPRHHRSVSTNKLLEVSRGPLISVSRPGPGIGTWCMCNRQKPRLTATRSHTCYCWCQ